MQMPAVRALALFAVLGVTGCASGVTGTAAVGNISAAPTTTRTSTVSSPPTSTATSTRSSASEPTTTVDDSSVGSSSDEETLASGVTIDELADDILSAQQVVDDYWSAHWSDFFTGTYQAPTVRGLYDGTDPSDTPTCDGVPLDPENAYYCEAEDYVAWDSALLINGADQIGDSWVYLVVAQVWAQAMQARLDSSLVASGRSLQADCLAAAALFGAVADGTLLFEPGDEAELVGSLSAVGDDMAWTTSSDHGDPFERVQWFTIGRNGGVNACLDVVEAAETTAPTS
jgi:uncharacterized protein